MKKTEILAADIGGTTSRFAHFIVDWKGEISFRKSVWIKTHDASSLGGLLDNLKQADFTLKPESATICVLAVAGPIEDGVRSKPPFISWAIDVSNPDEHGLRDVRLVNDFVAQAYACASRMAEKAEPILPGQKAEKGTVAVIGAGTGLGKAMLVWNEAGDPLAIPSEGGHAGFPLVGEEEQKFWAFIAKGLGEPYPTGNRIVSGKGLCRIHEFLTKEKLTPTEAVRVLAKKEGSLTLEWFARFYGRACRDFALESHASGGLYIAGGVAARTPEILKHPAFEKEFRTSPTMAGLLSRIPVYLITDQNSGLWGAALFGQQELRKATAKRRQWTGRPGRR